MVLGVRTHPFATSRSNTPEALETMHQPTSFRLSLPSGSEMRDEDDEVGVLDPQSLSYSCARGDLCHPGNATGHQVPRGHEGIWVCKLGIQPCQDDLQRRAKEGESDDAPQQAVGAGKATPDKAKELKKAEGDNLLKLQSLQLRQHSKKHERLEMRHRNEQMRLACRFFSSREISSLMRLTNSGRRLWRHRLTLFPVKTSVMRCMKIWQSKPGPPSWIVWHSTSSLYSALMQLRQQSTTPQTQWRRQTGFQLGNSLCKWNSWTAT